MRKFPIILALLSVVAVPAAADELDDASQAMCGRIQQCTLEQMGDAEGMSDAVKAQVTKSVEAMCGRMQENFSEAFDSHPLYQPAIDCMNSLAELSCAEFEGMADSGTPECAAYETLADQYSGSD